MKKITCAQTLGGLGNNKGHHSLLHSGHSHTPLLPLFLNCHKNLGHDSLPKDVMSIKAKKQYFPLGKY